MITSIHNHNKNELIQFIKYAPLSQLATLQHKSNLIIGYVDIESDVNDIAEAWKNRLGLKTIQISLAKKLLYSAFKKHYKDGKTLIEDIKNNRNHRPSKDYH